MKLIVLTGLVAIEKIQLAAELAQHFPKARVIDNVARLAMSSEDFAQPIERVTGDILPELPALLAKSKAKVTILAVSEETNPQKLFVSLDRIGEMLPDLDIMTIAMIDLRTCDCFPHLREALEEAADISLLLPYNLNEVLAYVD
jgi:hypothetical protein